MTKINGSTGIDTIQDKVYNATGVKNWIINGQFDVWQRGTSATSSAYNADDRWFNGHGISTKTTSRQSFAVGQTDVPNNPTYFSRTVVSSGNTSSSNLEKYQNIEDVTKLAGKIVTLSFWAKADASKNMSTELVQIFGTGGSSPAVGIGVQKVALTTTWQRFTKTVTMPSIVGKTVGTDSYTRLSIWFDAGSDFNARTDSLGNQSGTFDIANVCLVEGSTAMECPSEPYAEVLRKCQRYYWKNITDYGDTSFSSSSPASTSTITYITIQCPFGMRSVPTSVEYSSTRLTDFTTNYTISSITLLQSNSSNYSFNLQVNVTSGLTQYRPYVMNSTASSAYLAFSAEL